MCRAWHSEPHHGCRPSRPRRPRPGQGLATWLAVLTLALTLLADSTAAANAPMRSPQGPAQHVLLISVDGLRPDALKYAPRLSQLLGESAYDLAAKTVVPSVTLVAHASMLTGVGPDRHGITWNSYQPRRGYVRAPTALALARQAGLKAALFTSKEKLKHLAPPGSVDHLEVHLRAPALADAALAYLHQERPNLLVVHFQEVDGNGHLHGWLSPEYQQAVVVVDQAIGRLLDEVRSRSDERWAVIITADHGGHGRTHGTTQAEDILIPWIAWGAGIRPGRLQGVRVTDTAATALALLGVPVPSHMAGRPVFGPTAAARSASDGQAPVSRPAAAR